MNRLEDFAQTYSQAPWRKQLQIIGLFSLILVFIALIASIYLNVSARAATVGRDIQSKQDQIELLDMEIEDLQSQLALTLSWLAMDERARAMGFQLVSPDDVLYLPVPGYVERQTAVLAPHTERAIVEAPVMPPEYTESLFEWLRRRAAAYSFFTAEVQP
ncbi:MAG: hypothetical protein JXA78_04625 [Anaerolineales bacterium]|nr:hypothetical protein [Anaerolineales bacterium]